MKPKKKPAMGVHKLTINSDLGSMNHAFLDRLHALFSIVYTVICPSTSAMMAHAKAKINVSLISLVL